MTKQELAEYNLYQLDLVIDDLSSLAHEAGCAPIIGQELERRERRLKDLRIDCQSLQIAAE